MAYTEFTLDSTRRAFGLTIKPTTFFAEVAPAIVPAWLQETLAKGLPLALVSEKARSEFIIAPILLTVRELSHNLFTIYTERKWR
jgi:hypothetical protein